MGTQKTESDSDREGGFLVVVIDDKCFKMSTLFFLLDLPHRHPHLQILPYFLNQEKYRIAVSTHKGGGGGIESLCYVFYSKM